MAAVLLVALVAAWPAAGATAGDSAARYVIHISVDGLGSGYLQSLVESGRAPAFKRLMTEGASTLNARTDVDYTITLPNHTCMVTGRPVKDRAAAPSAVAGHAWVVNSSPGERTLHSNRQDYVSSTFDVVHDHGLRTCLFASKSKFVVYDQSYDGRAGGPDMTGEDNGRDKIDLYVHSGDASAMTDRFVAEMRSSPFHYSFLHFHDPDSAGHKKTWGSPEYVDALVVVDGYLQRILDLVTADSRFAGDTCVVLSADHGGKGLDHGLSSNPLNYTIPFVVWGAGVAGGRDLYQLNAATRVDPQAARPDYNDSRRQPIRNGDGANLSLKLLGLGAVPGSSINAAQDLHVQ